MPQGQVSLYTLYFIVRKATLNIVTFSWYCWVLFGITHPAPISYQEKRLVWFIIWSHFDFILFSLTCCSFHACILKLIRPSSSYLTSS